MLDYLEENDRKFLSPGKYSPSYIYNASYSSFYLSLYRAILRNPSLILCDEVTSSVDAFAERDIIETLRQATNERTTVTIAHRLSSVVHSDKIIVIDKGEIVEMGKHQELLAIPNGVYKRMWETQNLFDDSPEIATSTAFAPSSSLYRAIESDMDNYSSQLNDDFFSQKSSKRKYSDAVKHKHNQEFKDHLISVRRSRFFNRRAGTTSSFSNTDHMSTLDLLGLDRFLYHSRVSNDDFNAADQQAEEESRYSDL